MKKTTEPMKDPGPIPEELLDCPGFVHNLMEFTLKTAPYPNRPLAFAGALTMLAHLSGRGYRDTRNMRTNLYLIALAPSGTGKDHPRKVNINLASQYGFMPTMGDRFASAEGLEDSLMLQNASFYQVDEADTLFRSLQDKDSSVEKIYGSLLQFYTSSDTTYTMRKKALAKGCKLDDYDRIRSQGIRYPHLTLWGTAVPKYFYEALSTRSLENGLLARCLVLEADKRGNPGDPHLEVFPPAVQVDTVLLRNRGLYLGGEALPTLQLGAASAQIIREPYVVPEKDEDAKMMVEATIDAINSLYESATDTTAQALWTRGAEKALKLALLYAISENPENPVITTAGLEWGYKLASLITMRMLYMASIYVYDNAFDAKRQKALRKLKESGGSMSHSQLLRSLHTDKDTFRRIIDTLLESELIVQRESDFGKISYFLKDANSQIIHN